MKFVTDKVDVRAYKNPNFVEVWLDIDEGDILEACDLENLLDVIGAEECCKYFDLKPRDE